MKRIIIFLLTLAIAMQTVVFAEDTVNWNFENGVLTVWGSGEMENYSNSTKRPWDNHIKDAKKLVIKEGVTSIGAWSFTNFQALEEIQFPDSLKIIGERAFYNCSNISYIKLPKELKTIENGAFNSCTGAVRVSLPDGLEKIGNSAFMNLPRVPVMTIPQSVEYIGMWAFMGCTSLEQLYFEGDVPQYIGDFCLGDIYPDYVLYYSVGFGDSWKEFKKVKEEKIMAYDPEERIPVYLNNSEICFDIDPIIIDGRTLVPLRDVFEALGAVVAWNGETETATAKKGETIITIQIGADTMRKNNQIISLDVPAKLYYNRTFVPVRAVSEALEALVTWENDERAVYIKIDPNA